MAVSSFPGSGEADSSGGNFSDFEQTELQRLEALRGLAQNSAQEKLYALFIQHIISDQKVQDKEHNAITKKLGRDLAMIVRHATAYQESFSEKDHAEIASYLSVYTGNTGPVDFGTKSVLSAVVPDLYPDLFRMIHFYNLHARFEEESKAFRVPTSMRRAYNSWVKVNKTWIDEVADKRTAAPQDEADQEIQLSVNAIVEDIRVALEEFGGLPEEELLHLTKCLSDFIVPPEGPDTSQDAYKESMHGFFDSVDVSVLHDLFKLAHLCCLDKEMECFRSHMMPPSVQSVYDEWKQNNREWLASLHSKDIVPQQVASSSSESSAVISEAFKAVQSANLKYVQVDDPLVTHHNHDEMGSFPDFHATGDVSPGGRVPQNRTNVLVMALCADQDKTITVLSERKVEGATTKRYPYDIIEIEMPDDRARVLVCNWVGFSTFIIRNPLPLRDQPIEIGDLKDDPMAWSIPFVNQNQWVKDVLAHLDTPVNELTPQLKHRSSWYGKGAAVVESFIAHIVHTGYVPQTGDESPIAYGPLAGQSTWSRVYGALHRGYIEGLEHGRSFKALFESLKQSDPVLEKFISATPLRIPAGVVYEDCFEFVASYDLPPDEAFYDSFTIGGLNPGLVSLAFKHCAVADWRDYVSPDAPEPRSLDDFVVGSELAYHHPKGGLTLVRKPS